MDGASNLVIKVKYGDVLRRFNACVLGDELDINVNGLRKKISLLFSFPPDSDFVITYADDDGDDVMLVDDIELYDVVNQGINPLRITVQLKAESNVQKSHNAFDLSDTQRTLQEIEAIVKLAYDAALKCETSVQGFVDVLDSKLKTDHTRETSTAATGDKDAGQFKFGYTTSKVLESEHKSTKGKESSREPQSTERPGHMEIKSGNVNPVSRTSCPSTDFSFKKALSDAEKKAIMMARLRASASARALASGNTSQTIGSSPSTRTANLSGGNNVPARNVFNFGTPNSPGNYIHPAADFQFKDTNVVNGVKSVVTHHGVRCDYCGLHPITGPRFKSKVHDDFDLCVYCYYKVGNDTDYIRMDYPARQSEVMHYPRPSFTNGHNIDWGDVQI